MANTTITAKSALSAIIEANISEEVTAWATVQLANIDRKNASRATKAHEKADAVNAPIIAKIHDFLADGEVKTAAEVAVAVGVSTQKASALLRKVDGLTVTEVKGKSGKVKGYSLPIPEAQSVSD